MSVTHQRQAIRAATVAQLQAARTMAAERIFRNRREPTLTRDLPAALVYTLTEAVDPESDATAPRELTRRLQLVIEMAIDVERDLEDTLDMAAAEIERAIAGDDTLGGTVGDVILAATEMDIANVGEREIGTAKLTFVATYRTLAHGDAEDDTDRFTTADIRYPPAGASPDAEEPNDRLERLDE